MRERPRARVAVVSLHTSPLDQPGTGDSGGMNVYIRSVAERLGERGVEVDVLTRCAGRGVPEAERLGPLTRVVQVPAGPCAPLPKSHLPGHAERFAEAILDRGKGYDLVHAHYWLSGRAGRILAERWGVPLVASFHTLGRVKNRSLAPGDAPEPMIRLSGEHGVIRAADRILAPTVDEASYLVGLYRAAPERIRVVPPGVDHRMFSPGPGQEGRRALGLEGKRVALFVGRLQPHKAPDVAVLALAHLRERAPALARDLVLAVVGGPSGGSAGNPARLREVAASARLADAVRLFDPVPHESLPPIYRAADLVLMPSRSESFGLVALEAQATGIPVVASSVGGLRVAVAHERSGLLVEGHEPAAYAEAMLRVLSDRALEDRMRREARRHAGAFSWDRTADQLLSSYGELVPGLGMGDPAVAAPRGG